MHKLILERISIEDYTLFYGNMNYGNIYITPEYISALSNIVNIEIMSIKENNNIVALFPIVKKQKYFIRYNTQPPFTQFFNIIIKKNEYKEQKRMHFYERIIKTYINFLKKYYHFFIIPLYYDFYDIREFLWNKVSVEVQYSYILNINKETLRNIDRRIKNKKDVEYSIFDGSIIDLYKSLKSSYSTRLPISQKDYVSLIESLKKRNLIDIYTYQNTFIIILKDEKNKCIYEYNVGGKNSGILLNSIFNSNLYNNYIFDFQGANTKNIAEYKALFNPRLKNYYTIKKRLFGIYK